MEQRDHCKSRPLLHTAVARRTRHFLPSVPSPSSIPVLSFSSSSSSSAAQLTPHQQYILKTLISKTSSTSETSSSDAPAQPAYKYIANSTVIQHIGSSAEPEKHGRRGMHSAVGAFWNNEKDGTYSYKWEAAEKKGMDIVITITWIAI